MKRQWDNYRKDFGYAAGIEFKETCDAVIAVMDIIIKHYALSMSGSEIARQTGASKSGVNDFLSI